MLLGALGRRLLRNILAYFNNLARRTDSDKVLRVKSFNP